jgi:long-chain fatty acid transport protein
VALLFPSLAWAGGFELLGNGTEALGRGAAFTAKADDATALEYNIAGFAKQRGTRMLLDANILFHTYEFTRAGSYPLENVPPGEMGSAYAGQPFPKVQNNAGVFFAPFFGISTDFGKLDRWTFAIGAFGPSSVGSRDYGTTVKTSTGELPAPSRYDLVSTNLLIVFPTLAASYRVTKWLDLGLALHLAIGTFDIQTVSFTDLGSGKCYSLEFQPCDSLTHITADGFTATAALGIMLHPHRNVDIGINLRGPVEMNASGQLTTPGPATTPLKDHGDAEFHTHLPWILRFGLRYKFLKDRFEVGDVELDATYEAWNAAEGKGDSLDVPQLTFLSNIHADVAHNYQDTVSVRLGGAYNLKLSSGVLTFRLGAYYDSAATKQKDTRLDFDTMDKWAGTVGLGFLVRGVAINLAYAYVYDPDRNVRNGDLRALNAVNGSTTTTNGMLPVVNNGLYHAATQILSIGLTFAWDELLKKQRVLAYE